MFKLFFLGAGKMATAIAGGIVKAGVFQKSELAAFDVSARAAQEFEEKTGVHCYSGDALNEGIAQAEAVLLAVKPQVLASALEPLAGALDGKPVISIVAGVPNARLTAFTGSGRIVRVMPNTPALVGEGAAGYSLAPEAQAADGELAKRILSAVGVAGQEADWQMDRGGRGEPGAVPAVAADVALTLQGGKCVCISASGPFDGASKVVPQVNACPCILCKDSFFIFRERRDRR